MVTMRRLASSRLKTIPLSGVFGAEVIDVRADPSLSDEALEELRELIYEKGLVLLRGQHLSEGEQAVLCSRFGPVHRVGGTMAQQFYRAGGSVGRVGNISVDGERLSPDDRRQKLLDANIFWHTDATYVRPRAEFSILTAHVVPPIGGETEFCDTRVAYEMLSETLKKRVDGRDAFHSLLHSRALTGLTDWSEEERELFQPVRRSLVEHHKSGRDALVLASHIAEIEGNDPDSSRQLLEELITHATREDLIYTHRWTVGDLLIWDNRCTMHRLKPFDSVRYARDMRSLRTADLADAA